MYVVGRKGELQKVESGRNGRKGEIVIAQGKGKGTLQRGGMTVRRDGEMRR